MIYIFQGCFAAFIRGPKRKSMIVYLVCILVPSALYSLPHFFEHRVKVSKTFIIENNVVFNRCGEMKMD